MTINSKDEDDIIKSLVVSDREKIEKRLNRKGDCKLIYYLLDAFERKKLHDVSLSTIAKDLDFQPSYLSNLIKDWRELGKIRTTRSGLTLVMPVFNGGENALLEYKEKAIHTLTGTKKHDISELVSDAMKGTETKNRR